MNQINWSELSLSDFNQVGSGINITAHNVGCALLLQNVLTKYSGHVSQVHLEGQMLTDDEDEGGLRYIKKMQDLGGRLAHKSFAAGDTYYEALFVWDDSLVQLEFNHDYVKFDGLSQNEKWLSTLHQELVANLAPPPPRPAGHIFVITRRDQHLALNSLGDASVPLEPTNYTPKVMEDFKYSVKDLRTASPSGRIVIMEGEPGTGKTHLIRALLREVPDALFVLVSPEIVPSLAGPELLPLLMRYKRDYNKNGPIVLILEDADRCLVTRATDNMNSIQSLLNLGDGILGTLLDLRIIATTNANKLEMEAAILRPGRLSKRLEVTALDFQTSRGVFRRLLPSAKFPEKLGAEPMSFRMTLAEVYALARQSGWEPKLRKLDEENDDEYID